MVRAATRSMDDIFNEWDEERKASMPPQPSQDLAALHEFDELIAPEVEQMRSEQSLIPAMQEDKPRYEDVADTTGHLAGQALLSLGKGASQIGASVADLVMSPYDAYQTEMDPNYKYSLNKGVFPRTKEFESKLWDETTNPVKNAMGIKGTTAENIVGGIAEFIPSLAISGGLTKIPSALKTGSSLLGKGATLASFVDDAGLAAEKAISNKVLGKGANIAIKSTPDMVNTWLMMEGPKPEAERTPFIEWAAMWLGGEAVFKGVPAVAKAIKGKLGKGATRNAEVAPNVFDDWADDAGFDFGNTDGQYGAKTPNLSPFKPNAITPLDRSRMEWNAPDKLPQAPKDIKDPFAPTPSRTVEQGSLPDQFPVPRIKTTSEYFGPPNVVGKVATPEELRPLAKNIDQDMFLTDDELISRAAKAQKETVQKATMGDRWSTVVQAAEQAIEQHKSGALGIKAGPDIVTSYIIVGADKLAKGIADRAKWAEQMIKELGEDIRPMLPQIWFRSNELHVNGATKIKYAGQEIPISIPGETAASVLGKGANPQLTVNQAGLGKGANPIPGKMEQLPNGQRVRSTGVSMAEAEWADGAIKESLVNEMSPNMRGAYDPVKLQAVDAQAQAMISKNPQEAIRFVMDEQSPSALHTATGIRLVENLQNAGNYEQAIDIAMTLAENLTKSGQAISSARITGALKPDGVLIFAQRQINKINRDRKLPKVTKEVQLNPEDAQNLKRLAEIMQSAEGDAKIEASQELQGALQALSPSGILRKVDTTQTIGQLLNPKTMIRNILGNEMFYRLDRINKFVVTPIDWTRSKLTDAERTVTFSKAGQSGYWEGFFTGAKSGWKGVNPKGLETQYDLGKGLAFNQNPTRGAQAKTTAGKIVGTTLDAGERTMSYLERALGATLKAFDYAAYNRAYKQTLGEMATLRAINENKAGNKALIEQYIKEADDNMKNIADQYGKYVTFQDDNVISMGLSKVKSGLNLGQDWGFGSMLLKYPRTPGALIMRGIEYSPAGFLRSAYQLAKVKNWVHGESTEREAMLALSRAITGTAGLTGMGYYLADNGIITGSASNDKDVRNLQQQVGQGAYTVNLSALGRFVQSSFNSSAAKPVKGDTLINYDWAQPVAMALSMGANIQKSISQNENPIGNLPAIAVNAITGLAGGVDTIAEQPVLQGLQKLSSSYPGESLAGKAGRVVSETARDVPSSFTPTVLNQVRSLLDNQKRVTYDPNVMVEGINKAKAKIPGLADDLPKAYDTLGNEAKTYQADNNNPFNVFLNPAFITKYNPSSSAQMVIEIYNNTAETKQVPRIVNEYFNYTIKGKIKRVDLTPAEYSELQRIVGQETTKGFSKINPSASDESKIKKMVNVMNDAGDKGRKAILKARGIKT